MLPSQPSDQLPMKNCREIKEIKLLPGAGASWRAELPAVLTSVAVEASSWLGYSATVPATVDNEQQSLVKSRNVLI